MRPVDIAIFVVLFFQNEWNQEARENEENVNSHIAILRQIPKLTRKEKAWIKEECVHIVMQNKYP